MATHARSCSTGSRPYQWLGAQVLAINLGGDDTKEIGIVTAAEGRRLMRSRDLVEPARSKCSFARNLVWQTGIRESLNEHSH